MLKHSYGKIIFSVVIMYKQEQVFFYSIQGSTIKKFIIVDCLTATLAYYAIAIPTSSMLMGIIASVVFTEGIKRLVAYRALIQKD